MKKLEIPLFLLFFLFLTSLLFFPIGNHLIAQNAGDPDALPGEATLVIPVLSGTAPGPVSIPVTASGIVNVGSFQFSVEYDTALMTYIGTSGWYPGITDVLISEMTPGRLAFIWAGLDEGISLPQGTFFILHFEWHGTLSTSPLIWSDRPTPREFGDYDGSIFIPSYTSGSVTGYTEPQDVIFLENQRVSAGQSFCFNATDYITVGTTGNGFRVADSGSVSLISGGVILLLPNTRIDSGGYLSARITTTAGYCGSEDNSVPVLRNDLKMVESALPSDPLFRIIPDSDKDCFRLEIPSGKENQTARVTLYNMMGDGLLNQEISAGVPCRITLREKPAGLYFIRVSLGEDASVIKLFHY